MTTMKHLGKKPPYLFTAFGSATLHYRQSLIEAAEELEKWFQYMEKPNKYSELARKLRISAGEMEVKS